MAEVVTRRVNVTVKYRLSDEYIQQVVVGTGQAPEETQSITGHLDELPEDLRGRLIDSYRGAAILLQADRARVTYWSDGKYVDAKLPVAAEPFGRIEDAVAWYLDAYQPAYTEARNGELAAERLRREKLAAEDEERRRFREQARAREREREQRWQEEMQSWIDQHGSDRLRLAHERGYQVRGLYVRERAEVEFPGYTPDLDDRAEWEERVAPTEEALALETQAIDLAKANGLPGERASIVWLTKPPRDLESLDFRPCEAVVIRGYLGRYDLVKIVEA